MEEWKDIYYFDCTKDEWIDYRGLYQVSNLGRVKSLERLDSNGHKAKERILKTHCTVKDYLTVVLCKKRKRKAFRVHRLVASMFLPNPENKPCVDHINTKRDDNRAENLRWCSYKENNNNELTRKKYSEAKKGEKHPRSRAVIGINIENLTITIEYESMGQAQKDGFNEAHIWSCCNGRRKTHKGYFWVNKENYIKFLESLK